MSSARERVLASIRSGLVRAVLPDAAAERPQRPARRTDDRPDLDTLAARFTANLVALTGTVERVPTPADAAAAVLRLAVQHGARSFISWDDDELACPGIIRHLADGGVHRIPYAVDADAAARRTTLAALGAVPLGLTGADAALADTGSLVVVAGPGRGRLTSLLPPVHVAVVPASRLVASLGDLLDERPGLLDEASNVVCITGPSRTADIEMTLTHGVHGPKHVHVVLVG